MSTFSREKIILYGGGLFIGLIVLYLIVVKPTYIRYLDVHYKIEKKELLLKRYKAILEREDQLKERVAYIKKEFNKLNSVLLTGIKPSLAASEMQALLENISKKVNVTIKNIRNKKPQEKGIFYQIPIEIVIESTLREIRDVIYSIENSDKFLLVRDLSIRLAKSGNPEKLESRLIVDGFIKKNSLGTFD